MYVIHTITLSGHDLDLVSRLYVSTQLKRDDRSCYPSSALVRRPIGTRTSDIANARVDGVRSHDCCLEKSYPHRIQEASEMLRCYLKTSCTASVVSDAPDIPWERDGDWAASMILDRGS